MGAGKLRGAEKDGEAPDGIQKNRRRAERKWLRCCVVDKWSGRRTCCSWPLLGASGLSYSLERKVYVGEGA